MAKKEDKFLLVSLEESKTKKLAQVISNPTCHKILDFLAEKEATETEVSKQLKIAISTVHYNLQQLMDARLVEVEEFHYSTKGREVNHYKLANKYIIIAPKQATMTDKLKKFLPIGILGVGVAAFYGLYRSFFGFFGSAGSEVTGIMDVSAPAKFAEDAVADAIPVVAQNVSDVVVSAQPFAGKYLIIGIVAGMLIALLTMLIAKKLKK